MPQSNPFRLMIAVWVTGLVFLNIAVPLSLAQQPDRAGWSGNTEPNISLNRPGIARPSSATQFSPIPEQRFAPEATTATPEFLSEDIRNQIGLALLEEPVDYTHAIAPNPQTLSSPIDQQPTPSVGTDSFSNLFSSQTDSLTSPQGLASSIKVALLLATLSLAPAIVLMTTCYIRIIVVLTLLKQAFGAQQLPPTQVLTALSLFITLLVMTPVWTEVKTEAIDPYTRAENNISWDEAWGRGIVPVKSFMAKQINLADNGDSIAVFYKYLPDHQQTRPSSAADVPLNVLLPAFVVSELKVAFLLGFQIYLPFLVLDLVVASVTVSTGMMMLPPTMVSFPLKLILFVLVDGWNLVVGMLLQSFGPFT